MNTWKTSLALTAYVLATLAVALPLGAFNHYVLCENATNHTGASPYALFVVFVPAAVISIRMLQPNDRKWILPLVLAAAGSVNVLAFDAFHVMQEHENNRGQTTVFVARTIEFKGQARIFRSVAASLSMPFYFGELEREN